MGHFGIGLRFFGHDITDTGRANFPGRSWGVFGLVVKKLIRVPGNDLDDRQSLQGLVADDARRNLDPIHEVFHQYDASVFKSFFSRYLNFRR